MLAVFGVGQVLWSLFWFFLFFMWIMLLFQVTVDIFRSRDMSGLTKALWLLLVIVTPYLGVFIYLILRGGKMAENQYQSAAAQQAAVDDYIRQAAGGAPSPSAEIARLAELRDSGVIDATEFATLKAKVLG